MRGNFDHGRVEAQMFERLMAKPDSRGRRFIGEQKFDEKIAGPWQEIQPHPKNFRDIYSEDEIAADLKLVEEIKRKPFYQTESTNDAVFLEYGMMEGVHNNGWFGEGVSVTPTSEYDDMVNHVDFVAAVPGPDDQAYYLGVDITTSSNPSVQAKKLEHTLNTLDHNHLAKVKYFEDDSNPDKHGMIGVPRVVIGASDDRLRRIKEGVLHDRRYALDEDIKQELVKETLDQLANNVKYLLIKQFSESAESLRGNQEVIDYYTRHQDAIAKNQQLSENIEKHIGLIRYFESIREIK